MKKMSVATLCILTIKVKAIGVMLAFGLAATLAPSADPRTPGLDGDTVEASGADPAAEREDAAPGDPRADPTARDSRIGANLFHAVTNWDGGVFVITNALSRGSLPHRPGDPGSGAPEQLLGYTWFTNQVNGRAQLVTNFAAIPLAPPVPLPLRIRLHDRGATAEGGAFTVNVDGSLVEPIDILSPSGQHLRLRVAALGASDPDSGKRVWLAALREDCLGVVLAGEPLRIAWNNAFIGLTADVILQYNAGSVVHDVFLREPVIIPDNAGINPATARIELWSEVFEAPEPRQTPRPISLRPSDAADNSFPGRSAKTATDVELGWTDMKMVQGKAFRVNPADAGEQENWPVARNWYTLSNHTYIIETVDYDTLKSSLEKIRTAHLIKPQGFLPAGEGLPAPAALPGEADVQARQLLASWPSHGVPPRVIPSGSHPKGLLAQWDARQTADWNRLPGIEIDWIVINDQLINVDFGIGTTKQGGAAIGKTATDFWNAYPTLTPLHYSDTTASFSQAALTGSNGTFANSTGDPMYDVGAYGNGAGTLTLSLLPQGVYDIYLYAHGPADDLNGSFTWNGTLKTTGVGAFWNNNQLANNYQDGVTSFIENGHHVVFRNISVAANTEVAIALGPNSSGYSLINGLQIKGVGNMPPAVYAGSSQTITYPATATLYGTATDDGLPAGSTLSLRWDLLFGPGFASFSPQTAQGGSLTSIASFSAPGVYTLRLTASDGDRTGSASLTVTVTAPANTPPTISAIANRATWINTTVAPIAFTVGDAETPAANLIVTAISDNPTLISNDSAHLTLGGSGASRTLTVAPASGQTGSATIQVTVRDGANASATAQFNLTVSAPGAGTAFDLKTDWSDTANTNGVWAYRRGTTPLSLMSNYPQGQGDAFTGQPAWTDVNAAWYVPAWFRVTSDNASFGSYSWQTGDVIVHTANTAPLANVAWTAPSAGTVNIAGHVWMVYSALGRFQQWKLYQNNTLLASGNLLLSQNRANPCYVAAGLTNVVVAANDTIQLEVAHAAGSDGHYVGVNLTLTYISCGNIAPAISPIPNQTIGANTPVSPIAFTVSDVETPAANLSVYAISLNPTLVPNDAAHLSLGGSGTHRTLTVTPAGGQTGYAAIEVTVSDGTATNSVSFTVTVWPGRVTTWDLNNDWSDSPSHPGPWAYRSGGAALPQVENWQQTIGDLLHGQPAWAASATDFAGLVPAWFKVIPTNAPYATYSWQAGDVIVHSANAAPQANVAWTAPAAGTVNIAGHVWMVYSALGRLQQWKLYQNSTELRSGSLFLTQNRGNPCNVAAGLTNLAVAAGDTIQLEVAPVDGNWGHYVGANLTVTAFTPNTPPTISAIPNQLLAINTATPALGFTIGDAETPTANLSLNASSSNPALVPTANAVLGGSGTNRTVTVTPVAGQTGSANLTLTVSDGFLTASAIFTVTVRSLPTVNLMSPAHGASLAQGANVFLQATATPVTGISQVEFFATETGATPLAAVTASPYQTTCSLPPGTYHVYAKVTDWTNAYSAVNTLTVTNVAGGATVLLLHLDGANGGTAFSDSSAYANAVSTVGAPTITTADGRSGGACLSLNGSSYLTVPSRPEFCLGGGDFTVEFWVKFNTTPTPWTGLVVDRQAGSNNGFSTWYGEGYLAIYGQHQDASGWAFGWGFPWTPTVGTWYHVAFVRGQFYLRCFVNGTAINGSWGTPEVWAGWSFGATVNAPMLIGAGDNGIALNGCLDEVRVSRAALYENNFTPSSGETSRANYAAAINFDHTSGNYTNAQNIVLTSIDGSTFGWGFDCSYANQNAYAGPIPVTAPNWLSVKTTTPGANPSYGQIFVNVVTPPAFAPNGGGPFTNAQTITLNSSGIGYNPCYLIHSTNGGTTWQTSDTLTLDGIGNGSGQILAYAHSDNWCGFNTPTNTSATFTFTCPAPTLSPSSGSAFGPTNKVTLADARATASMSYKIGAAGTWTAYPAGGFSLPVGTQTVYAHASDTGYGPSADVSATYTVYNLPTITLMNPTNGMAIGYGSNFLLQANATAGSNISKVEFFTVEAGATPLATVMASPYQAAWTPNPGTYHVYAKVTDWTNAFSATNALNVVSQTPIAWWRLNETNGTTAADASGWSHNGTTVGNPAWLAALGTGSGLVFDGTDDQVTVPNSAGLDLTGNLTMAFWMKQTAGSTDWVRLVGKGDWSFRNYEVWIEPPPGNHFMFQQADWSLNRPDRLYSQRTVELGVWTHVAAVVENNAIRMYLNGQLEVTALRAWVPPVSATPVTLGFDGYYAHLAGALGDVRLYNRPLSAVEIQNLYDLHPVYAVPTVTLTSPTNNMAIGYGSNLLLQATATAGSNISKVEFFTIEAGAIPIATATVAPYQAAWTPNPGTYHVYAKATDWTNAFSATNALTVVSQTPIAWWRLNETAGTTAADSSGWNHHGTTVGNPAWLAASGTGSGLVFDGTDDQVTVPNSAGLDLTGNLTMSFWMKQTALATDWVRLVGKGDWSFRNYEVWIEPPPGNHFMFQQADWSLNRPDRLYSQRTVELGVWTHVAAVVENNAIRMYLNGQLEVTALRAWVPPVSATPVTLGFDGYYAHLTGALDDVRLYNRPLSAAEVQKLSDADRDGDGLIDDPSLTVTITRPRDQATLP